MTPAAVALEVVDSVSLDPGCHAIDAALFNVEQWLKEEVAKEFGARGVEEAQ